MTTYTTNLGLALPATGDLTGTWGQTANDAITSLLDSAVAGTTTLSADADVTLTDTTGSANQARQAIIRWTAGGTVTRNITAPARTKVYVVINATSGSQSIVFRGAGPTAGVTLVAGERCVVAWSGTDFVKVASTVLSGIVPIASGGTGLSTIPARSLFVANTLDTLTTLTPGAGQSIRINAGNTTWEVYTPAAGDVAAASNNAFTGANTFHNATGQTFGTGTSTQDGIIVAGRAGGSSSYRVTLAPGTLTASRSVTFPDAAGAVVLDAATQTLTNKTISGASNTLTVDGTNGVGFREIPQNSQSTAYTLVLADSGKHILHPSADTTARTFTIPANGTVAFPIGTAVTFINQNGAGVVTISITTDTMRLAGAGTTGSRTLAANGIATAVKITSTEWIISGTGLT